MSVKYFNVFRKFPLRQYKLISSGVNRIDRIITLSRNFNGLSFCSNRINHLEVTPSYNMIIRVMSSGGVKNIEIKDYLQMKEDPKTTIIDVREKSEIADTGILPGGTNIPLGDVANALQMDPANFQKLYNIAKPSETDSIIFSCRSGKRSLSAAETASKLNYENVFNLQGGWLAWEEYLKSK